MTMTYIDIYALIPRQSRMIVDKFHDTFFFGYQEQSSYYEFPQFGKRTEFETDDWRKMLTYILSKKGRNYRFYFKPTARKEIQIGYFSINIDETLTLGVTVQEKLAAKYIDYLLRDFGAISIVTCQECEPPVSTKEFDEWSDRT